MEEYMTVMRDPKMFYFDWPKGVDGNLKNEVE